MSGGHSTTAWAEDCVDPVVGGQERLRLLWRLEPPDGLFPYPDRSVRSLDAVAQTLVCPVIRAWRHGLDRLHAAAQFICDHKTRLTEPIHRPLREAGRGLALRLDEDDRHITVGVDRPPEPVFHAVDRHRNLVQMPRVGRTGSAA